MKRLITSVTLLVSSGLVLAGADMSMQEKDSSGQQDSSYSQERTGQQPGIGDRSNRFDGNASVDDFFERDEWSVITNEDIYGSF